MRTALATTEQLGFDSLLANADEANERRILDRETAHLPGTWKKALPYYRTLIDRHHAAMLEADEDEVLRLKEEATQLAAKLNGGTICGICAPGGSAKRLEAETASKAGEEIKWGQVGSFVMDHEGMAVRIEINGIFGIGGRHSLWSGFSAHVVDRSKPFLSETGYRSFLGHGLSRLIPGQTPEQFVAAIVGSYVTKELRGKLVKVQPKGSK